jgi:hypothetical protein
MWGLRLEEPRASEARDAEEVRDLLSRYFETCRQIITRYGGVVEKFIGDAVMAVWGTPAVREDDGERSVRAGLDLTEAVTALGIEAGVTGLRARVGVLSGEAVATLGAQDQGLVAGDLVNRVADPGRGISWRGPRRRRNSTRDRGRGRLRGRRPPRAEGQREGSPCPRRLADVVILRACKDEVLRDELLGAVSVLSDIGIERCANNFSCRQAVGHDLDHADPPKLTPT